ncbi:type II-A CRISPR-associated protein Csn2 [Limosilactobacillus secaliphilus]|uniref:type II-A CRISPR-associated protein Csn2 n=1 Tax=Limosilactobacillus secaliphilus TaxID=396268 RepID=UPI0009F8A281
MMTSSDDSWLTWIKDSTVIQVIQESILMADLPLTLNYDGDLKRLLTYCWLHFINESTIEPYDIINHDLKVHLECDLDSVVCFCNLSNYLDRQEFSDIISDVTEINIPVLLGFRCTSDQ